MDPRNRNKLTASGAHPPTCSTDCIVHVATIDRMNDYNDIGLDNQEPMESDMVDDAPEPDMEDGAGENAEEAEPAQKITTKFLTKYERGKYSAPC